MGAWDEFEEGQLFEYLTPSQRLEMITDVMATLAVRSAREDQKVFKDQTDLQA